MVSLLLQHPDIDPNARNSWGSSDSTVLLEAARKGEQDIVQLLLDHPDIDVTGIRDAKGRTPLQVAQQENSFHPGVANLIAKYMKTKKGKQT